MLWRLCPSYVFKIKSLGGIIGRREAGFNVSRRSGFGFIEVFREPYWDCNQSYCILCAGYQSKTLHHQCTRLFLLMTERYDFISPREMHVNVTIRSNDSLVD